MRNVIVGFAVQRETEVVHEVIVARIYLRVLAQPVELAAERVVEFLGMTAVVTVAGPGVE